MVKSIFLLIIELFYVKAGFVCDKQPVSCGCGLKNVEINTDISEAQPVVPHSWSMVVSLQYDCHRSGNAAAHCCSGTVISESYILTSAQCVHNIDPASIISGGVTILAGTQQRGISRTVDQLYIHPNWTQTSGDSSNNIAVVHLTGPFDLATNVFTALTCRPPRLNSSAEYTHHPPDDTPLVTVGWSSIRTVGSMTTQVLHQTAIRSADPRDSICGGRIKSRETQFCERLTEDGTG